MMLRQHARIGNTSLSPSNYHFLKVLLISAIVNKTQLLYRKTGRPYPPHRGVVQ